VPANKHANLERIDGEAAAGAAQAVFFPELFPTGYWLIYDSAASIERDGSRLGACRKMHLFDSESDIFSASERSSARPAR